MNYYLSLFTPIWSRFQKHYHGWVVAIYVDWRFHVATHRCMNPNKSIFYIRVAVDLQLTSKRLSYSQHRVVGVECLMLSSEHSFTGFILYVFIQHFKYAGCCWAFSQWSIIYISAVHDHKTNANNKEMNVYEHLNVLFCKESMKMNGVYCRGFKLGGL